MYFGFSRPYLRTRSETKSERVYLLPDPPEQRAAMPETDAVSRPMIRLAPPEIQELYAQDPALANKGYEIFLEKLRENGFEH